MAFFDRPPVVERNYPVADFRIPNPIKPDLSPVDPYNFVRPIFFQLTIANARTDRLTVNVARPSLIRITGINGPNAGPNVVGSVDCPLITATARGGTGGGSITPVSQFVLIAQDLCIPNARNYLHLPFAGQWTIEVTGSGDAAGLDWSVQAYVYEGFSAEAYSALVNAAPYSAVTFATPVVPIGQYFMLQLGGGSGYNNIGFREVRIAAPTTLWEFAIGNSAAGQGLPIAASPGVTLIDSDLIPMGSIRIFNGSAGAAACRVAVSLDP